MNELWKSSLDIKKNLPIYFIQGHSSETTSKTFKLKPDQWIFYRVKPGHFCVVNENSSMYNMIRDENPFGGIESLRQLIMNPNSSFRRKGQLKRPGQFALDVSIDYKNRLSIYETPVSKSNYNSLMELGTNSAEKLQTLIGNKKGIFVVSSCRSPGASTMFQYLSNMELKRKKMNNNLNKANMASREVQFMRHNNMYNTNNNENTSSMEKTMFILADRNKKAAITRIQRKIEKKLEFPHDAKGLRRFMRSKKKGYSKYKELMNAEMKKSPELKRFMKDYLHRRVKRIFADPKNEDHAEKLAMQFIQMVGLKNM